MQANIHKKIIDQIGAIIESGKLKGGDRLPPERKLAERLMVSRNTIREAIKTLSEQGVLESRKGAGTFITTTGRDLLETIMIETLEKKKHRLKEILELREIIEPQIAVLAAKRINTDTIKALLEVVAKQEKAFASGQSITELDNLFHGLLARAAGNAVLFSVYEKLHDILSETRTDELQNPERNLKSIILHKEIIGCLELKDSEGVEKVMKQHMLQIKDSIIY